MGFQVSTLQSTPGSPSPDPRHHLGFHVSTRTCNCLHFIQQTDTHNLQSQTQKKTPRECDCKLGTCGMSCQLKGTQQETLPTYQRNLNKGNTDMRTTRGSTHEPILFRIPGPCLRTKAADPFQPDAHTTSQISYTSPWSLRGTRSPSRRSGSNLTINQGGPEQITPFTSHGGRYRS